MYPRFLLYSHNPRRNPLPFYLGSISQTPPSYRKFIDWSDLDVRRLRQLGGETLLKQHLSLSEILSSAFPEFRWTSTTYYSDSMKVSEKRVFVDRLLLKAFGHLRTQGDLFAVRGSELCESPGGASLLVSRNGSIKFLLREVYKELTPNYVECRVHRGYWRHPQHSSLLSNTMKHFSLKEKVDWYRLSVRQVMSLCGKEVKKNQLVGLLEKFVPEEDWDNRRFSEGFNKKSRQRYLGLKLSELYPTELIFEDHFLQFSNKTYIFDYYLPGVSLVVEYQGEQHYYSIVRWISVKQQEQRDKEKEDVCRANGLKLICVPFWWDNTVSSLRDMINKSDVSTKNDL